MFAAREAQSFLEGLERPSEVQTETLLQKIVRPNAGSDFGKRHGFERVHSIADYQAAVPIRSYEDFRPDIERILAGEEGVLTTEPVRRFFLTSGSTAKPKYIPVTNSFTRDKSRAFGVYWSLVFAQHPGVAQGNMITNFSDSGEIGRAPNGLPASSESAYWSGVTAATTRKKAIIPKAVARIADTEARYYTIARILLEEDFAALMTLNPSTIYLLFQKMGEHAEALIKDVRDGGLSAAMDATPEAREHVAATYRGNPARALELAHLAAGPGMLACKVWPKLELVVSWRSPMLAPYLRLLDPHLAGVAGRDYISMASEGVMSIPVRSGESGGALATSVGFYELIPEEEIERPSPRVVLPEHAEVGKSYVLVMSTSAGLYRYNIGDVVRVAGFEKRTPITQFLYRAGNTCSLTGEKLTEDQVTEAVSEVAQALQLELESFTAQPAPDGFPRYAFLLETRGAAGSELLLRFARDIDQALCARNIEYASKRESKRLGAPEVWRVAPGSYAARRERRIREGANDGQLKPVHLTRNMDFHRELSIEERVHAP